MNKQVLSPFDCDMCAMIEDITQQEINVTASDTSICLSWSQNGSEGKDKPEAQRIAALKQAIRGRLGDRFIEFSYADNKQSVYMKYDPEEYPEEVRTKLADPDATAGSRYCRIMLEVDAIQFRRDNVNDVLKFTGGGTVTTPRTPNGKAVYSFPDGNGKFIDVPEDWFIIREPNGRFTARPEKDFKREFELKGNVAPIIEPVPYHIQRLFSNLFGNDIEKRCRKLTEEYNEFMEVVPDIFGKNIAQCTDKQLAGIIDELADVNAVIFHIAGILGLSQWELVLMAYDKVSGRQINPNYKRSHLHADPETGCGNCVHFLHKDADGNGYCEAFQEKQNCGIMPCQHYINKQQLSNE